MKRAFVLTLGLATLVGCPGNNRSLSVTGQIEAISVDVGSKVGGRVAEVPVKEGDLVVAGDVLVKLESDEAAAMITAARAKLAQAEAHLAKLEAGARVEELDRARAALAQYEQQYQLALNGARSQEIEAGRAAVRAAQALRDDAALEYARLDRLFKEEAVPRRLCDKARHQLEAAEAELRAARERLDALIEGVRSEELGMAQAARDQAAALVKELENGPRQEDLEAARALRAEAEASLRVAEVQAREMVICAPMAGVVDSIDVHPGDLIRPGPLVRVTNPDLLELIVYVSAPMLGHVKLGQEISLTTDSHGNEAFPGKVVYVASQGEYTPRNLQTEEQRALQMFAVKLQLDSAGGRLKAGMAATAHFPWKDAR